MLQTQIYSPECIRPPENADFRYPAFQKPTDLRSKKLSPALESSTFSQQIYMLVLLHTLSATENHPPKHSLLSPQICMQLANPT